MDISIRLIRYNPPIVANGTNSPICNLYQGQAIPNYEKMCAVFNLFVAEHCRAVELIELSVEDYRTMQC